MVPSFMYAALFTTMSQRPKRASTSRATRCQCSSWETSARSTSVTVEVRCGIGGLFQIDEDELCPALAKLEGNGATDPIGRAGHNRNPAFMSIEGHGLGSSDLA